MVAQQARSLTQWILLLSLGLVAGFLSGMFGVGGGILVVPGLIAVLHFPPKLAAGTSLAAIVPLASVGVISYAVHGSVSWWGALVLAIGAMIGAKIGTRLLVRIEPGPLQMAFSVFMLFAVVSMFLVVPDRGAALVFTPLTAVALIVVGVVTGILSGLFGVGGGVIVVPALMLLFGAGDLIARGTSLLMMIPAALIGTVSNVKNQNVDLTAALAVGIPACLTTFLGSRAAATVSPEVANMLFAIFLTLVAIHLFVSVVRKRRQNSHEDPQG